MAEKAHSDAMNFAQNQSELKLAETLVSQEEAATVSPSCLEDAPVVANEVSNAEVRKPISCSSQPEQLETQPPPCKQGILMSSFLSFEDQNSCFKHAQTKAAFGQMLKDFVTSCMDQQVQQRHIVLILTTDNDGNVVIGGDVISESELYGQLNSCFEHSPSSTLVLQFNSKIEGSYSPGCSVQSEIPFQKPNRASFSGFEVCRFEIQSGANLLKLHQHVSQLFSELPMQGADVHDVIRRIDQGCSSSVKLVTACGFPSAAFSQPLSGDSKVPGIPMVAGDMKDSPSSSEQVEQFTRMSTECSPVNVACGVVVKRYEGHHQDREGSEKDVEYITESTECLGCSPASTYVLFDETGMISKHRILSHLKETREKWSGQVPINCAIVFISAHGGTQGFKSSYGEFIRVEEVVQLFCNIAKSVLLVYQACRGERHHEVKQVWPTQSPVALRFDIPDGCCLPPSVENCGAIFASGCDYVAYRNKDGSRMLRAFRDVVASSRDGFVSVRKLAGLVQARIHETTPRQDGKVKGELFKSFVQIQYSLNGGGGHWISLKPQKSAEC